jgi:hypothetical protein
MFTNFLISFEFHFLILREKYERRFKHKFQNPKRFNKNSEVFLIKFPNIITSNSHLYSTEVISYLRKIL